MIRGQRFIAGCRATAGVAAVEAPMQLAGDWRPWADCLTDHGDGNHEYLLQLRMSETQGHLSGGEQAIEQAVDEAFAPLSRPAAQQAKTTEYV